MSQTREQIKAKNAQDLRYTASMLGELKQMAAARGDRLVGYFIEMAYLEACDQLRVNHAAQQAAQRQAAA